MFQGLMIGAAVLLVLLIRALMSVGELGRRVTAMERQLESLRLQFVDPGPAPDTTGVGEPSPAESPVPESTGPTAWPQPEARTVPPPLPGTAAARTAAPIQSRTPVPPPPSPPGWIATAMDRGRDWFLHGNVPVKIGMLVLLAGVAALLRYANDQGWLTMPIELRLLGISLAALGGLVFGWHVRRTRRAFGLAAQGGAIGVLLLTIFAAARLYALMPGGLAFGLSVALVAGLGALAVLQDSRALAVLGVLAGFMAPIWLSDGSGSHVTLFSYYALLNLAILAVAWWRSWWLLNLLGFVFTWGVGIAWGVLRYAPHLLPTTQPFLVLFFLLYFLIPMVTARKRTVRMVHWVDGVLLFGTPLVAFAVQATLWRGHSMVLAHSALALAVLYAASGWAWRRCRGSGDIATVHAVLAAAFATVLVPLAFPGDPLIVVFAMEGAALVWFGAKRGWRWGMITGLGLWLIAMFGHLEAHVLDGGADSTAWVLLNPPFLTGMVVVAGAWISAASLHALHPVLARILYLAGLCGWVMISVIEAMAPRWGDASGDLLLVLAMLTAYAAVCAWPRWRDGLLGLTGVLGTMAGVVALLVQMSELGQPLAGSGWLAWFVYAVLGWMLLRRMRVLDGAWVRAAWLVWWLVWPIMISVALRQWLGLAWLGQGWVVAATALPWLALMLLANRHWWVFRRPLDALAEPMRQGVQQALALLIGACWLLSLWLPGSAAPLPWVPVLNPLELTQLVAWVLLWSWLHGAADSVWTVGRRGSLPALAGLAWITSVVLHAVHHWGAVPWDARLFDASLAQTSLTITWSVLGVAGWIIGSRRGHHGLWLGSAMLMAVVLAKLMLIDRQHLGDLLGIGSFIAYGLLCTVVGYVAPAPPRATPAASPSTGTPA